MKNRAIMAIEGIKDKLLAGRAVITLVNTKYKDLAATHRQTFKIWYKKEYDLWYVFHKTSGKYVYIGALKRVPIRANPNQVVFETTRVSPPDSDERFKVFHWFWFKVVCYRTARIADLEIWHEGMCCRCGRPLTVPDSIRKGIGPVCEKKLTTT